jgi:antitoxin component YwqK of YwqJK toxin-antitoxin module
MKLPLLIAGLFITISSFGQKLPEVGTNVRINEADKTIVAEIRPVNSTPSMDPSNTYYWYGSGLIRHTQGGYSGRLLNGTYSEYYLNKNLKEQGAFTKGLKTGTWKTWTENGVLKQLYTYQFGVRSGFFSLYDDAGKPIQSGNYDSNELNGEITYFSKDSVRVVKYKNGREQPKKQPSHFFDKLNIFKKHQKTSNSTKPPVKP